MYARCDDDWSDYTEIIFFYAVIIAVSELSCAIVAAYKPFYFC